METLGDRIKYWEAYLRNVRPVPLQEGPIASLKENESWWKVHQTDYPQYEDQWVAIAYKNVVAHELSNSVLQERVVELRSHSVPVLICYVPGPFAYREV